MMVSLETRPIADVAEGIRANHRSGDRTEEQDMLFYSYLLTYYHNQFFSYLNLA